jgi:hypothetical protein
VNIATFPRVLPSLPLNQRKTWQFAKKTVYFDFGNETLFERTENGLFRKITRQDFLSHYLVTEV